MKYKHVAVSLEHLAQVADKTGAKVGDDYVTHFINTAHRGQRLVGFSVVIAPVRGVPMPHFHFVFEDGIVQ